MDTNDWNINPMDLLKSPEYQEVPHEKALGQDNLGPMFDTNYEMADDLLSKELQDLDIPMIPSNNNGYSLANYDLDWNQLQITDPKLTNFKPTHKKGMSGTAIFGFSNHNKTLSISSLQRNFFDPQQTTRNIDDSSPNLNESNDSCMRGDNYVDINGIIQRQKQELKLALEKQKEVNRKLEEQLLQNRLQQEQIQNALREQDAVAQNIVNISPQYSRTPLSNNKRVEGDVIVTSNSKNGSYQFPPPSKNTAQDALGISPSNTNDSGSPSRSYGRFRATNRYTEGREVSENFDMSALISPHNVKSNELAGLDSDAHSMDLLEPPSLFFCYKRGDDNTPGFPYTPKTNSTISTFSSRNTSPKHKKKTSTISTTSTIPQPLEDSDYSDQESKDGLIGLGIQGNPTFSLKNAAFNTLPTIPGSKENTPAGKKMLPKKHTFQHTPTKNSNLPNSNRLASNNAPVLRPFSSSQIDKESSPSPLQFHNTTVMMDSPGYGTHSPNQYINAENWGSPTLTVVRKGNTLPRDVLDRYVKELPDKKFQCLFPDCHKFFKRRYNIRSHIQTHLEDRPYKCDHAGCEKAFVRNHDLVRHKKTHAEKIYSCPCGKKFNREDALIAHRSRLICSGGKLYENNVVNKSPTKKRGKQKADELSTSPVRDSMENYVMYRMEDQLRNEMQKHGLLQQPRQPPPAGLGIPCVSSTHLVLSPSPSSGYSDLGSPSATPRKTTIP